MKYITINLKNFAEPFDTSSWMLVTLVAIQAAALSIYVFEWFSPVGHNMKEKVFIKKYFE